MTFDLTRSFLKVAGTEVAADRLDGYDIIDHVARKLEDSPRTLFWRGKRGDRTWSAVRHGDLKYVRKTEGTQREEWLFNLADDPGELDDLRETEPARFEAMLAEWDRYSRASGVLIES